MGQDIADNNQPNFKLSLLPKKTFEIKVIILWSEIDLVRKAVAKKIGESLEIKGFRKGKVPLNLILKNIDQKNLLEKTLGELIPKYYQKAIDYFKLKPIVSPKIEVLSIKDDQDWEMKFTACEEPVIDLGNYKDELKKLKKIEEIWTPGKSSPAKETPTNNSPEEKNKKILKIIEWLLKNIKVEISELLLEDEINRELSKLLEQIQKLGLTLDQYLASTGKTIEKIREEYRKQAENNLALEFILRAVSEKEKIEVSPEEITKTIAAAKDETEQKTLESQRYLLAALIRQQKALDFLLNL